ncbi:cellulose synthase subunit BcsC-related outer membrane protein [Komagataeibacter rhaeticus]|nr:cellulose synthase subunit BcsC-related outer membrane protein [Komagataeibacter rhaeticus]WPP21887.1 cellulose synthase subunit BcsC-related outer membrane protein [Komagataeibacter rhaeticus]SAY47997.1 Cellulose synthase operon protein C precursor [Komagataeibacter rhaeticus]
MTRQYCPARGRQPAVAWRKAPAAWVMRPAACRPSSAWLAGGGWKIICGMVAGVIMAGEIAQAEPAWTAGPDSAASPAGGSTQITVTPDAGQNAANAHLAHAAAVLELLLNQGYYWLGQHNLPKARETIQRALSIEPDNNEALFLLGRLQMAEGQTKLAAATLGRLIQNGNAPGLVADLRAQIHAGPIDPRGLAEARALAAEGKMMPAMFKYRALFKNGDPPPDLAMEYYRVLGATTLGYQEAATRLAAWVARNPRDLDAKLSLDRILTYHVTSRDEGLEGLRQLARSNASAAIRDGAIAAWRDALLWEPVTGPTIALYNEWLDLHPGDAEIIDRRHKAQDAQNIIDGANYRQQGFVLLSRRNIEGAADLFHRALAINAHDADSLGGMALVAQARQQPALARHYFQQAIQADPDSAAHWRAALKAMEAGGGGGMDPLVARIIQAINSGHYDAAQSDLALLGRRGNTITLQALQGMLARRQGHMEEAERLYREILRRAPGNADALFNLGGILIETGREAEAQDIIARLAHIRPDLARHLEVAGLSARSDRTRNNDEKLSLLNRAMAMAPTDPWIRLKLARALDEAGNHAQAQAIMDGVTSGRAVTPDDLQAAILYAMGRHDMARAEQLLARLPPGIESPGMARVAEQIELVRRIQELNRVPRAPNALLVALADRPDPTGERGMRIANALLDRHAPQDAQQVLATEERLTQPPQPSQLLAYAGVYLRLHSAVDATRCLNAFDAMARARPTDITADQQEIRNQIAIGLAIMTADGFNRYGQTARAYQVLAPVLQAHPDSAEAHLAMGRVYQTRNMARRALEEDQIALRLKPHNIYALAAAARDAGGLHQMAEAKDYSTRLAHEDPDGPMSWEVRSDIERIEGNTRAQLVDVEHARHAQCTLDGEGTCDGQHESFLPDYRWPEIDSNYINLHGATLPATYHYIPEDDGPEAMDRQIVYLRDSVSPQIDANSYVRSRTGTAGLGQLTEFAVPITGTLPFESWEHRLSFSIVPTLLFTGNPLANPYSAHEFGTYAINGALPGSSHHYYTQGVGLSLNYVNHWFSADVGSSPLGFPITNVVGGVEFAPRLTRNLGLRISGGRRMVTDSELSYAGMRDPGTGRLWGGVTRMFGHGALEWSEPTWNLYAGGGFAYLGGTHVVDNTEVEAGAGGSATVWQSHDRQWLRVGLDLMYFGYKRDTYSFTWGQGGYFSPQQYYGAMIPVEWSGHDRRWTWFLRGEAGFQHYHSNGAPYYPTDSALQALSVAHQPDYYGDEGESGLAGNIRGRVVYQFTHRLRLGMEGGYSRAGNWSETSGMWMAHYTFDGQ